MDQQAVGVLLRGMTDGRLAHVDCRGQPAHVARVADLQAVQGLGRVSDLFGDPEVVVEKTDQTV